MKKIGFHCPQKLKYWKYTINRTITNFDITKNKLKYYLANDCEIFSLLKEKNVIVEYADTIKSKRTKPNRTSPKWCKITNSK